MSETAVAIAKLEEAFKAHDKHDDERFGRIEGHTKQIPALKTAIAGVGDQVGRLREDIGKLYEARAQQMVTDAVQEVEIKHQRERVDSYRAKAESVHRETGLTTKQKLGAWAAVIGIVTALIGAFVAGFDAFRTALGK